MATVTEQETIGLKTETPAQAPTGITVTPKAADEVRRIVAEQQAAGTGEKMYLRMRVVGGGCSGFQHKLDLDTQVNPKLDEVFQVHGVEVVVDKRSLLYLNGVTVDYHNDLNRRGFSVSNPQAKSTCGCGSSFSM
ncbi:MAG TPA: iron-sulfur cluster assembly accessory protein [Gemmataceae bacterium]|jgi:iron-sulfur cluster assembly protein|nr:iron-sulfur cluster assembly accessory protein [Gemmataceae bacterium]